MNAGSNGLNLVSSYAKRMIRTDVRCVLEAAGPEGVSTWILTELVCGRPDLGHKQLVNQRELVTALRAVGRRVDGRWVAR